MEYLFEVSGHLVTISPNRDGGKKLSLEEVQAHVQSLIKSNNVYKLVMYDAPYNAVKDWPHDTIIQLNCFGCTMPLDFFEAQRKLEFLYCDSFEVALVAVSVDSLIELHVYIFQATADDIQRFVEVPKKRPIFLQHDCLLDFRRATGIVRVSCHTIRPTLCVTTSPKYIAVEGPTPEAVQVRQWMEDREVLKRNMLSVFLGLKETFGEEGLRRLVWSYLKPQPLV